MNDDRMGRCDVRQPRRVTIYDVAERAGVSISTVSLAINSPHRVREATRARVLAAAGALGYRTGPPSPQGRAGIRIAVAAPFGSYPTYLRRLTGMLGRGGQFVAFARGALQRVDAHGRG